MSTTEDQTVAAGHSLEVDPARWQAGLEQLLGRAVWDQDGVRDDVRAYLVEALGDPEAVLVVDETGDLKKASQSVGCSARTSAPRAGSRTPRSPSSWWMPAMAGTP